MKKLCLILSFFLITAYLTAQETYTVQSEILQLKTEIDGELDLLWNTFDGHFRYFVRTSDNHITELINTKDKSHHFQEEYKTTLQKLTNLSTDNINLTLSDLTEFIDHYNLSQDSNYESVVQKVKLQLLLDVFGGITNSPFIDNPNNVNAPQFGSELELLDSNRNHRHALFLLLRHVFETDEFKYSATEMALGYRFRFINSKTFSVYGQTKFATLNFVKNTVPDVNDAPVDFSETVFDIPFTFGVGADIRLTEQSFLTLHYNELFAVLLDNNGHFPTNMTIGYKFSL